MSNKQNNLDTCGCCEGVKSLTPVEIKNRPGLAALFYRVGSHGSFKKTMISDLSKEPALKNLKTRENDDPAIALCDTWALVLDVLSFYQERIANEGYLRTATERRSILEMARSIGYELNPGVAAGTYLAFTLETAEGSPASTKIAVGTKVQSIPGQDEKPQVFETIEVLQAQAAWNALKPKLTIPQEIGRGVDRVYLKGTDTRLQPGDAILIVGEEREKWPGSENWDFRIVQNVLPDDKEDYTLITWEEALGHEKPTVNPAGNPKIYAIRQRASLFGHNAPDWRSIHEDIQAAYDPDGKQKTQWPNFKIQQVDEQIIDLDRVYPDILEGSFILLRKPKYIELYKAVNVVTASRTDYTLTSKTTRIKVDAREHLSWFGLRDTEVFAQSEQLEFVEQPLTTPVFGNRIVVKRLAEGLKEEQLVVITGQPLTHVKVAERKRVIKSAKDEIVKKEDALSLISADGSKEVELTAGDILKVVEPPELLKGGLYKWHLVNEQDFSGFVTAEPDDFLPEYGEEKKPSVSQPVSADKEEEEFKSEISVIEEPEEDGDFTVLKLVDALKNVYLRHTVTINANVVKATHGESKTEVLGSGDGSKTFQEFVLKQVPLTYVSAVTASGTETTLNIRVNDILWHEAPSLYEASPDDRVYMTRLADDEKVTVTFGDGITGARLPTGTENIVAEYRVGIGFDGLLKSGQLSLLMTPQLGVKSVINPLSPSGADDPENIDQARRNAPFTVLTMERIVSLRDFEDFVRAYTGIGKARADWLWSGEQKLIHITAAGVRGAALLEGSEFFKTLVKSIDAARHPNVQVQLSSYTSVTFDVKANILVDDNYIPEKVLKAVSQALQKSFSFDSREFGQAVSPAEVIAVMQGVPGVTAADLEELDGIDPFETPHFLLRAKTACWDNNNTKIEAAELLTINRDEIVLEEMKK